MRNSFAFAVLVLLSVALMLPVASAQTFEKKNYNYSDWTKVCRRRRTWGHGR